MKKKIVMVCVAAMTLSLVGCGSKAATEESSVVSEQAASSEVQSTVEPMQTEAETTETAVQEEGTLGKVTAIDGDTITVALGEMDAPEAPSGEKTEGQAPSGDKPEGEAPSGDKSEGEAPSGDKPEGEAPNGDNKVLSFKESGETVTITLDDTVTIQVQDGDNVTEGTSDDIAEGSIISIVYDGDGNVTSIQVVSTGGQPAPDATADSSEETATTEE